MAWTDDLPVISKLRDESGSPFPVRKTLHFAGSAYVEDNATNGETDVVLAPYSGTRVITPAELGANVNNYAPTDAATGTTLSGADLVRVSSDGTTRTITGLVMSTALLKRKLILVVDGAVALAHESGSSSANNRFLTPTLSTLTLFLNGWADVLYDTATGRVRVLESFAGQAEE